MELSPIVAPPLDQRRIGVVVPYDMALDRELWRWTPYDVSLHFTRTPFLDMGVTMQMITEVGELDVVYQCARNLSITEPEVYVYACTSGSFVGGLAGEHQIRHALNRVGPHALTTSGAMLEAFAHLSLRRVAVASPYRADVTAALVNFVRQGGYDVSSVGYLSMEQDLWKLPYERTASFVTEVDTDDSDAVFVSCTNVPTFDMIERLEARLGKPVLSANQVTIWAALRRMRLPAMAGNQWLFAGTPVGASADHAIVDGAQELAGGA